MPPQPRRKPAPARNSRTVDPEAANRARNERRTRKQERSREDILAAARRLMLKGGIPALTLEAVARECGLSKASLYYYFPSKDALLFDLVFGIQRRYAEHVSAAVEKARTGSEALRTVVSESARQFAGQIDDFRLVFLHSQVASQGEVEIDERQLEKVRPLNDMWFAGAAGKLAEDARHQKRRMKVDPRMLAFLAYLSAIGLATMKGMVESVNDPLRYTDEELIEGLARVFEAAASA